MTRQAKEELKRETARRMRKPFTDALLCLTKCREGSHSLDPKDPKNSEARRWLYISGKSWARELRASRFAYEAAAPDSTNDRAMVPA